MSILVADLLRTCWLVTDLLRASRKKSANKSAWDISGQKWTEKLQISNSGKLWIWGLVGGLGAVFILNVIKRGARKPSRTILPHF